MTETFPGLSFTWGTMDLGYASIPQDRFALETLRLEAASSTRSRTTVTKEAYETFLSKYPQYKIVALNERESRIQFVAVGDNEAVLVTINHDEEQVVVTTASSFGMEAARGLAQEILSHYPPIVEPDDKIGVKFWTWNPQHGQTANYRTLQAAKWDEVCDNYAEHSREALQALCDREPSMENGKLILLHGPVGTGKTNMIRALAQAWKKWCTVDYVVDPEEFFGIGRYMLGVLLDNDDNFEKWRLIVVEDSDELIGADAKVKMGQSMQRLLNVCDGLVGQGLKVMILITTNEPLGTLHPAVIRPGRCMANLEVGKLSTHEANIWREKHGLETTKTGEATLAELYSELREAPQIVSVPEKRKIGFGAR